MPTHILGPICYGANPDICTFAHITHTHTHINTFFLPLSLPSDSQYGNLPETLTVCHLISPQQSAGIQSATSHVVL